VDHEIEHHVNIQASRAEQAETVDFEEERKGHHLLERCDGGIVTLQMTDLQDAAVASGRID
jgi:hypothetical protein